MSTLEPGSYVTHSKMPELGAGEVLSAEQGTIRIRFATGERNFLWQLVADHLTLTAEAPPRPATKPGKRARSTSAAPRAPRAKKAKA